MELKESLEKILLNFCDLIEQKDHPDLPNLFSGLRHILHEFLQDENQCPMKTPSQQDQALQAENFFKKFVNVVTLGLAKQLQRQVKPSDPMYNVVQMLFNLLPNVVQSCLSCFSQSIG